MKFSGLAVKVIVISLVTIAIYIGMGMANLMVMDREGRFRQATTQIGEQWGEPQVVAGPFIRIPGAKRYVDGTLRSHDLIVMPEQVEVRISSDVEQRYRGIYRVLLYESNVKTSGRIQIPDLVSLGVDTTSLDWSKARLEYSLSDTRGIRSPLTIKIDGRTAEFAPRMYTESGEEGLFDAVVSTPLDLSSAVRVGRTVNFQLNHRMQGSDELKVVPVGKTTKVQMSSNWAHPGFIGSSLPASHAIHDNGFTAEWSSGQFSRSYPQAFIMDAGVSTKVVESAFGVSFVDPVDVYHQLERSTKYVMLIITLTFTLFFIMEIVSKLKIHPMQYLFVGVSLLIFYLLLFSTSEMMRFDLSFLISSTATVILVTAYLRYVVHTWRRSLFMGSTLAAMLGFIYVLLSAESFSLLFGSIGLFIMLAILMFVTRNVDWYAQGTPGPVVGLPQQAENDQRTS